MTASTPAMLPQRTEVVRQVAAKSQQVSPFVSAEALLDPLCHVPLEYYTFASRRVGGVLIEKDEVLADVLSARRRGEHFQDATSTSDCDHLETQNARDRAATVYASSSVYRGTRRASAVGNSRTVDGWAAATEQPTRSLPFEGNSGDRRGAGAIEDDVGRALRGAMMRLNLKRRRQRELAQEALRGGVLKGKPETSKRSNDKWDDFEKPRSAYYGAIVQPPTMKSIEGVGLGDMSHRALVLSMVLSLWGLVLSLYGTLAQSYYLFIRESPIFQSPVDRSIVKPLELIKVASILGQDECIIAMILNFLGPVPLMLCGAVEIHFALTFAWTNAGLPVEARRLSDYSFLIFGLIHGGRAVQAAGQYVIQRYCPPSKPLYTLAILSECLPYVAALHLLSRCHWTMEGAYALPVAVLQSGFTPMACVVIYFSGALLKEMLASDRIFAMRKRILPLSVSWTDVLSYPDAYLYVALLALSCGTNQYWMAHVLSLAKSEEWPWDCVDVCWHTMLADFIGRVLLTSVADLLCCEELPRSRLVLLAATFPFFRDISTALAIFPPKFNFPFALITVMTTAFIQKMAISFLRGNIDNFYLSNLALLGKSAGILAAAILTFVNALTSAYPAVPPFAITMTLFTQLAVAIAISHSHSSEEIDTRGFPLVALMPRAETFEFYQKFIPTSCLPYNIKNIKEMELCRNIYYWVNTSRALPSEVLQVESEITESRRRDQELQEWITEQLQTVHHR